MIRLSEIRKRFGAHEVLKGIDLTVEKGEIVAIIGPSGSGKSTLLRSINFLEPASSGTIAIGEHAVDVTAANKQAVHGLKALTGMVFQHYNLFANLTALDNVTLGLKAVRKLDAKQAKAIGEAMLEKVGLADKAKHYPSQLSGGQQQRVGIARALALNPAVLLLDEPTSSLDPELVDEVLSVIKQVANEGMTMLIVTHELRFAKEIANRVVLMEDGAIVEQGSVEQMFTNPQEARTKQFIGKALGGDGL